MRGIRRVAAGGLLAGLVGSSALAQTPYWTNGVPLATPPLTGSERFPADTYASSGLQQEGISVSQLEASVSSGIYSSPHTWSALQTYVNSDWALLGSSTGVTVLTSDNASGTSYVLHLPAANDTIAVLGLAQTLVNKTLTSPTLTNPTVTGSFTATGLVTNSDLVASAVGINGVVCSLGSSCSISAAVGLVNYLTGCQTSAPGGGTSVTIQTPCTAADSTGSGTLLNLSGTPQVWTKTTGSWAAGSTQGCLDIGAVARGWYGLYLIYRADTKVVDLLCSLSNGNSITASAIPSLTISNASPGVVTWADNGLQPGAPIVFQSTGTLPTGLTAGTQYFVKTVLSPSTFTVSLTQGGSVINTSSVGSGVPFAFAFPVLPSPYTLFRRVAWLSVDGSGNWGIGSSVGWTQQSRDFFWNTPQGDFSSTSTGALQLLSPSVPYGSSVYFKGNWFEVPGGGNNAISLVSSPYSGNSAPSTAVFSCAIGAAVAAAIPCYQPAWTNKSGQIQFRDLYNTTGYTESTVGWTDPAGGN